MGFLGQELGVVGKIAGSYLPFEHGVSLSRLKDRKNRL